MNLLNKSDLRVVVGGEDGCDGSSCNGDGANGGSDVGSASGEGNGSGSTGGSSQQANDTLSNCMDAQPSVMSPEASNIGMAICVGQSVACLANNTYCTTSNTPSQGGGSGTTEAMQGGFGSGVNNSNKRVHHGVSSMIKPHGKVICTELCRYGVIEHDIWMADLAYSRKHFSEQTMRGYHAWGVPYVKLMRKYPMFARLAKYPTAAFAQDIAYRMGVRAKPSYMGWIIRELAFRPVCWVIGIFVKARDWQSLWSDNPVKA